MTRPRKPPVSPTFQTVDLQAGVDAALASVPKKAGVAEIIGTDGRCLIVGKPSNLRTWFASRLGRAKPPRKPGMRPPTDLTAVTSALAFATTSSAFHQRLAYERRMAFRFPNVKRRDLKPPAYLHLDPSERFPRLTVRTGGEGGARLFGPFAGPGPAEKARGALHKLFPLRPCDFHFEPHPELPLGQGCLYAQVRSCAAPCLVRVTEEAYRALAGEAAAFLAVPSRRASTEAPWIRDFVGAAGAWGLVIEKAPGGLELYPVRAGVVADAPVIAAEEALDTAVATLAWPEAQSPGRDAAWLTSWLFETRRRGRYVAIEGEKVPPPAELLAKIRAALAT